MCALFSVTKSKRERGRTVAEEVGEPKLVVLLDGSPRFVHPANRLAVLAAVVVVVDPGSVACCPCSVLVISDAVLSDCVLLPRPPDQFDPRGGYTFVNLSIFIHP